jgi:hypothetical protein
MIHRLRAVAAILLGSGLSCASVQALSPPLGAAAPLTGLWVGRGYTCPGGNVPPEEQIRIEDRGGSLIATKIAGDDCVPSGAITWQGVPTGPSFPVQVQMSSGPHTPLFFAPATITVVRIDTLQLSAGWTVVFQRVRP